MFRYLPLIGLLFVFTTACAPAPGAPVDMADPATPSAAGEAADDDHGEEGHAEDESHEDDDHGQEHEDHDERRELGAHEHGAAELTIAWSDGDLAMDLRTPAYNVLGFEYAPASAAEQAHFEESVAALEAGALLQLSPDAECALVDAAVETDLSGDGHEEEGAHSEEGHDEEGHGEDDHGEETHADDDHDEGVHSDIEVAYRFACGQPDRLEALDVTALFAQFPNFDDIRVQWISDTQQSAGVLTDGSPVLALK